ncbi:DDE-type integrase/transposase/recombinase [Marinobacter sp. F3R08]|uniref:DDE-type integrase/transposase/recombinase n=1 Tax=Marinobacter sp. F3R08 TaxID=2841559 RepID=UPI001C09A21D|nr:DDE-type integrase/transposase/recombinase [Marinobacter sp. F3R08]MBU2955813.1 transposase family protein [Marinobacter sp. F3R08]
MTKPLFGPGSRIVLDGKNALIAHENGDSFVLFTEDAVQREVSKKVLQIAYQEGRMRFNVDSPDSEVIRKPFLTSTEAKKAEYLLAYLEPMTHYENTGSKRTAAKVIKDVVRKHGDAVMPAPKPDTLYKWFRKWTEAGKNILVFFPAGRTSRRKSSIAPEYLELMTNTIDELVLTRNHCTIARAYREFRSQAEALESKNRIPSKQAFYDHYNRIDPRIKLKTRQGNSALVQATRIALRTYEVRHPLERVEIDAAHLTMYLVDEYLNLIANKVIVYLAIDVYSKAIVGFAMDYGINIAEKSEGVTECLKSVLRDKHHDLSYLTNPWPGGKPTTIVGDPGTAIISEAFTTLAGQLQIHREVTEARQGWKKPHIESYFKVLRADFLKRLRGYVPKRSPLLKFDHSLKDLRCFMAAEFEKMMITYLVNGYNHAAQPKLNGMSPHEKWLEGIEKYGEPEMVNDLSFANSFGGNLTKRVLNPTKGIHLNDLKYNSVALQDLYFRLVKNYGDRLKVEVRWSSQVLTKVMVLDPETRTYLTVPCTKDLPEGMTLSKLKAQKKLIGNLRHSDTLKDSEEFQNVQTRARDVGRSKRTRKQPPATDAQPMSNDQLEAYFRQSDMDSNSDPALSPAANVSDVMGSDNEPSSSPKPRRAREFKIRERG